MPYYLPEGRVNRRLFIVLTAVEAASSWYLENAIPRVCRDAEKEGCFGVVFSEGISAEGPGKGRAALPGQTNSQPWPKY